MKDRTVRYLVIIAALALIFIGLVLFYVFDKQGMRNHKTNNYINYNVNDYIDILPIVFNDYDDVYSNIDVSKVNFKNIDNKLISDFLIKQDEYIGYINSYYNQIIIDDGYMPVSTVSSTIKSQMNGAILSVFYQLNFNLDENVFVDNYKSYVFAINIDLATNKIVTKEDLLSKYNYSKSYIADKLFNEDVLIGKNEVVIDKTTNISLTRNDVERKKEIYVNRIVSEFNNIMEMYIEDNSLVLVYNTKSLKDIFFDNEFDTNIKIRYLK